MRDYSNTRMREMISEYVHDKRYRRVLELILCDGGWRLRRKNMGGADRMKTVLLCLGRLLLGAALPAGALVWACWQGSRVKRGR